MRRVWCLVVPVALAAALLAGACSSRDEGPVESRDAAVPSTRAVGPPGTAGVGAKPRVVFLGDSLTAGLGLSAEEAYPSLIRRRLEERALPYDVVNASVSGDTSAGGLSRLDWALDGNVKVLVVALGGNDGLRGLPVGELTANLSKIIERAQARGVTVVLAGMEAPPNFGDRYTAAFRDVYPALAKKYRLALVPFLLRGVAAIDALNQRDGIHPNRRGAEVVADNVWGVLEPTLENRTARD